MTDSLRSNHDERADVVNRRFRRSKSRLQSGFFHVYQLALKMSHPNNSTNADSNAETPRLMVPFDGRNEQLTVITTLRARSAKVPKTFKPWYNTRAIVASVATGTAIAVALWFSYFAARVLMRAVKGRRYRRQAGM